MLVCSMDWMNGRIKYARNTSKEGRENRGIGMEERGRNASVIDAKSILLLSNISLIKFVEEVRCGRAGNLWLVIGLGTGVRNFTGKV